LEPNVVKALIASESDFDVDPSGNIKSTGIAQQQVRKRLF